MIKKDKIFYYIAGYLNMYFCDCSLNYDPSQESLLQHRLRNVFCYLGLRNTNRDLTWLSPFLSIGESVFSTILVFVRFFFILIRRLATRKKYYNNQTIVAPLIISQFRIKKILESIRPVEVCTLKIPFINNCYHENEIDLISVISVTDIFSSWIASWKTIWILYLKYRNRDPLFRSYSSFEYYLTCSFIEKTKGHNRFVYYNTYDRWAFLMSNTPRSIFIQHGKLPESLHIIKVGTPEKAFYINESQRIILEKVLLKYPAKESNYRPLLEFTCNDLLENNGKKNVLLVCWSNNINYEQRICQLINSDCNLLIKPHPGDKDNPEYVEMKEKYGCKIVPKTGYPKVDIVISYDSTLADEYDDAGVRVIRYDLLSDLCEIRKMI